MRVVRLTLLLLASAVTVTQGQSALYRPPNLLSTWVPSAREIQFNFIHRFRVLSDQSGHKVLNYPTFALAPGLGHGIAVGIRYASNSTLIRSPFRPNEAELFGRVRFGVPEGEPGFAGAITPAYNTAARSFDSELALEYSVDRVTLLSAGRYATNALDSSDGRAAVAGGLSIRLTRQLAISGDLGAFVSPSAKAAWSVGLDFAIPASPHTLALEVSNVTNSTIQGNSIGGSEVLYGFEFTVPIRW